MRMQHAPIFCIMTHLGTMRGAGRGESSWTPAVLHGPREAVNGEGSHLVRLRMHRERLAHDLRSCQARQEPCCCAIPLNAARRRPLVQRCIVGK